VGQLRPKGRNYSLIWPKVLGALLPLGNWKALENYSSKKGIRFPKKGGQLRDYFRINF